MANFFIIKLYLSVLKLIKNKNKIVKFIENDDVRVRREAVFTLIDILIEENDPSAIRLILECVRADAMPRNVAFLQISKLTNGPNSTKSMKELKQLRNYAIALNENPSFLRPLPTLWNISKKLKKNTDDENFVDTTIEEYSTLGANERDLREMQRPRFRIRTDN